MAINPLIALQGEDASKVGSSFVSGLQQGNQLRASRQLQDIRGQQAQQQQQRFGQQQLLGQQQLDLGQQRLDLGEEQLRNITGDRQMRSITQASAVALPLLEQGDIEGAKRFAQERIANIESIGGDASDTIGLLQRLEQGDIEGVKQSLTRNIQLGQVSGILPGGRPQEFKSIKETEDGRLIGLNAATGQFEELPLPEGTQLKQRAPLPAQRGQGAIIRTEQGLQFATPVFDPATRAVTVSTAPIEGELVSREGETAQEKRQASVEAEVSKEAGKQAIDLSGKAFERLEKVNANIANYDDAIRVIDEGAQTGAIASRLPSFKQASIELDNVRKRLGLDIISATTFGALSEGELDLALDTALPNKLAPQDLKAWLIAKKQAQQKLSSQLEEAAAFLGQGNTIADYIQLKKARQVSQQGQQGEQAQGQQVGRFSIEGL